MSVIYQDMEDKQIIKIKNTAINMQLISWITTDYFHIQNFVFFIAVTPELLQLFINRPPCQTLSQRDWDKNEQ